MRTILLYNMSRFGVYNNMQRATLEQYINDGYTQKEMAKAEGVTQTTIVYWLKKHNLKTKWKRGGWSSQGSEHRQTGLRTSQLGKDITQWDWAAIQDAHNKGAKWDDLCNQFGINIAALSRGKEEGLFNCRTLSQARKLMHERGEIDYAKYRTEEFRKKQAVCGGYKPRSGTGKGAWAINIEGANYCLQSSYEIRMASILNDMKILWERPESISYILNEKSRRYYADFLLPLYQIYLDTKNEYLIPKDMPKIDAVRAQSNIKLYIIEDHQITRKYIQSLIELTGMVSAGTPNASRASSILASSAMG